MKKVNYTKEVSTSDPILKGKYFYGVGRRKRSVAQVRLYPEKSGVFVNGKEADKFWSKGLLEDVLKPLVLTGLDKKFGIVANVHGGGKSGSSIAARLGVARALLVYDAKIRIQIKPQGMLKRDSRKKERKKAGLHKARRGHQFSKR